MFKFAILFCFTTVLAKLDKPNYGYILFEQFNNVEPLPVLKRDVPIASAWVLSLDEDVENLKLRVATSEETREVFGARLHEGPIRQPGMKKDPRKESSNKPAKKISEDDEKAMLKEIMRLINKFALTTRTEPDVYLGDDSDKNSTTIKLYFKGEHTSLVVRAEGRQWHYLIGPASLFPAWFYEEHSAERDARGPFVGVPDDVTGEFYAALFHMLTLFLSFPV